MKTAIYRIEFNDTVIALMCILIIYYVLFPLLRKTINLIKEYKKEGLKVNG